MTAVSPLDQPASGDRTFPALDFVRAVGALMVLSTHVAFDTGRVLEGWTGAALARLDFGVALFFVLSGFLLSRPFFLAHARGADRPSTRHYLWKRALRILPLYWVVVVAALLLEPGNADAGIGDWVRNLTLTQIYSPGLYPVGLTQMWSLATEAAFYLVLPMLCAALLWRTPPGTLAVRAVVVRLAVLSTLGVAWQVVVSSAVEAGRHQTQWLPGHLPWFAVGIAFAAVSVSVRTDPRPHVLDRLGADLAGCWLLATAVFAVACTPVAGPLTFAFAPTGLQAGAKTVLYTVSAALYVLPLVFGPERDGAVRRFASARGSQLLGELSYAVFSIHMLVIGLVFHLLDLEEFTGGFGSAWLLTVAITLPLAALSYYLLERPVLRLKNRGPFAPTRTRKTASAAAAAS